MKSSAHGGDWAAFLEETGALPLDFSASISPLGLPDGVNVPQPGLCSSPAAIRIPIAAPCVGRFRRKRGFPRKRSSAATARRT